MKEIKEIVDLDQLKPYLNKDGLLEIVQRDNKKKYKAFANVRLGEGTEEKAKDALKQIAEKVNKNGQLIKQAEKAAEAAAKISKVGVILSAVNICVTIAGTIIIYKKLKDMESQINQQLDGIQANIKDSTEGNLKKDYNEALSEHMDMLDRRSRNRELFTEDEMRKLVDKECNVLDHLIDALQKDYIADVDYMIFVTMSLLSMYTTSLCYYDEQSYFNNRQNGYEANPWHLSHERWMKVYDVLSGEWFTKLLQDNGMFNSVPQATTSEVDAYYLSMLEQVEDMRQRVIDNMDLIQKLDNEQLVSDFRLYEEQSFKNELIAAFNEIYGESGNEEVEKELLNVMNVVATA